MIKYPFFASRPYSMRKSRSILRWSYQWYKKYGGSLPTSQLVFIEETMEKLDQALLRKERLEASRLARELEQFGQSRFKKSFASHCIELASALLFALIVALFVRQMWFEPYEIPTGSMRPTFKEQDHLTVTKTAFGINFPLETKHLYFDPSLTQRASVLIFSGDNIALPDTEALYFGFIPYKKRYIKRCIGKPGDTLYFYGGKIYGVDREGNPLEELLNPQWMGRLEHIPFLSFDGHPSRASSSQIVFRQMHQEIGRLTFGRNGKMEGEIFDGLQWKKDNPLAAKEKHSQVETYTDFWGMRNFAMSRLLTKEQAQTIAPNELKGLEDAPLYLELRHTPSLTYPAASVQTERGGFFISLTPYTTLIPLQQKHLDALMENMYTARFDVKNGRAARYAAEGAHYGEDAPLFPGTPDGRYEFYYGKGYRLSWGGIACPLPDDSPLYKHSPAFIQKLYNLGIDFSSLYAPRAKNQLYYPHRYAYFRDGDLYLLGAPILKKEDPALQAFIEREQKRESASSTQAPYIAFKDHGAPLKEGKIDRDFIQTFGLKVPERSYLVLGDNHAMSADSRVFGFVPEENLQGAPSLILWPPGQRWGFPLQRPYPLFNLPRTIVWSVVALIGLIWRAIYLYRARQPIFKKRSFNHSPPHSR